jgi:NAD(P)-dependent dehydrogenase (short-subunit alcohol dehydrogenase family)
MNRSIQGTFAQEQLQSLFAMAGKRILVIGGAQGIGEATANLLASLGCDLAIMDIQLERIEQVCAKLLGLGVSAFPVAVDVTDESQLVAALAQAGEALGPLDGMAAVVGAAGWSPLVDMTTEAWDHDQSRNLRYFFIAARELARSLLERGAAGSMVAIASVDGIRSAPGHGAYGAAKAGLIHLVKTMASEWSDQGIRVNCVAPGPIVTERVPLGDPQQERAGMAPIPMRRRGTADEVARAVAFFLSDMSTYVTGQTLAVDGGYAGAWGFGAKR